MNLKSASLLALIGMILLSLLLVVVLLDYALNVMRGLVPAVMLLSQFIYAFASVTVTLFFFVFHRTQS